MAYSDEVERLAGMGWSGSDASDFAGAGIHDPEWEEEVSDEETEE